ncbi:MAG: hypothetical protein MR703_07920 [Prevotella sp.]|nr:hypothetical protein [Prevotella sp.]MDY4805564.1 hypothetical protein [Prevotella sp.]
MKEKVNPIQRKFFFGTIAETTRKKIIRYLKKNNYDFEETYDYKIIVRNITFEGFYCKEVTLTLFREVVFDINADLGVFKDENLFKSTSDKLRTTFNCKYENYCIINEDTGCAYEDENTVLNFVCRDKQIVVSYTATNVEMITSRKNVTLTHKIYYKVCLFSTAQSLISLP